jgi:hypothetical protein
MVTRAATVAFIIVGLGAGGQAQAQNCTVPLLMRGPEGFSVELLRLAADQVRVFPPGGVPALVAPVLPVGRGMAGDLVAAAEPRVVAIRCTAGEVRVSLRAPDGSGPRDLPAVAASNYARYELRVNVTDDRKQGVAFLIREGRVERADGPVLDMFQGRVPMAPGDVAITLEVREPTAAVASLVGTVALTALGPWAAVQVSLPGGRTARFVLDLGASRTVVARQLLAPETSLHELVAVEQSGRGTRRLAANAGGAGGAAKAVGSVADLAWLDVAGLRVDSVHPLVMDQPLIAGDDTVFGIVGLDVLRRAGRVRGTFGAPAGTGSIVLGGAPLGDAVEVPLREVQGLLLVEGRAGAAALLWLLDSGSRVSVVPDDVARREGWVRGDGPVDSLRGIDETPIPSRPAVVPPPHLGSWQAPSVPFVAASFPVVGALGLTDATGILGQPFFRAVGEIEIDFERGVLRVPRGATR